MSLFFIAAYGCIILSVACSYIFSFTSWKYLFGAGVGGTYGYRVNEWLIDMLGLPGTGVLIFFVLTAWLVPIVFRMVQRRKEHRAGKAAVVADSAPETLHEPAREIPVPEEIHVPVLEVEPPAGEKNTPSFEIEMAAEESTGGTMELYDPKLDLPKYRRPELSLLEDYKDKLSEVPQEELERNNQKIVECLRTYNIQIEKIVATPGPTVTLYKIVLNYLLIESKNS